MRKFGLRRNACLHKAIEMLEQRTLLSLAFGSTESTVDSNMLALPGDVQSADIDGDGKQDIIVGSNASGVTTALGGTDILLSNGDGTFTIHSGPAFPSGASATSTNAFAVGNLGNGMQDLIYAQQNANSFLGVITPEMNTSTAGNVSFAAGSSFAISTPADFNPQQVVTGDFNGDSKLDAAVLGFNGNGGETLVILTGNGSGGFSEATQTYALSTIDGQLLTGDFNGDGKTDLAVYDPISGNLYAFLNTTNGSTVTFNQISTPFSMTVMGYTSGPIAAADFSGDGKTDLAVGENGSSGSDAMVLFLAGTDGSGNLTFTAQSPVPANNPQLNLVGAIAAGDFTGDGDMDVVEDYGVLLGDGHGNLASPTAAQNSSLLADAQGYNAIFAADFNGDGKLDIAAVEQSSHTVFAALSASTSTPRTSTTTVLNSSDNPAPQRRQPGSHRHRGRQQWNAGRLREFLRRHDADRYRAGSIQRHRRANRQRTVNRRAFHRRDVSGQRKLSRQHVHAAGANGLRRPAQRFEPDARVDRGKASRRFADGDSNQRRCAGHHHQQRHIDRGGTGYGHAFRL